MEANSCYPEVISVEEVIAIIYITGDTHIPVISDIRKLSSRRFPQQKQMTRQDSVMICGDFGGVWDNSRENQYWIDWLRFKNFTTLFIDGNHENFELLDAFEETELYGGKVHKITEGVYHLCRGEIFTIEGRTFFVMGGAVSHDRDKRTPGVSWWPREVPSEEEMQRGRKNLKKHNWQVDYILTHCAPGGIQKELRPEWQRDAMTDYLDEIREVCDYSQWFFGHYHIDKKIDNRHICVFQQLISLL